MILIDEINRLEKQEELPVEGLTFDAEEEIKLNESVKYNEYGKKDRSVMNITDILDEKPVMKGKYNRIESLKKDLADLEKEEMNLNRRINDKHSMFKSNLQLFEDGSKEIGKELLKLYEIQLDKQVNGVTVIRKG